MALHTHTHTYIYVYIYIYNIYLLVKSTAERRGKYNEVENIDLVFLAFWGQKIPHEMATCHALRWI